MAIVRFVFVLQCIFLLNIYCQSDINENIDEIYRPQIWCFVNHLNSDPNRVYNYNYATLISAQNKDIDSTELILDIEVDCHQSNKCITTFMQCNGTVAYNSELANYELIPGYVCAPKIRIDLARDDEIIPQEEKAEEHSELEQPGEIDLTHEVSTDGQVSGEQFVAIRQNSAYCLGCPMDLNTNIEGLDLLTDTALKHIETERTNKQALIRIVRIQQQVVSGIKYILQIEIAPTTCPKNIDQSYLSTCTLDPSAPIETCEITYFQQPWISKTKNIISNNCTESQEYTVAEPPAPNHSANDLDNEIDVNFNYKKTIDNFPEPNGLEDVNEPNYDTIAETGHADDILKIAGGISIMDSSRMKETESQIIHQNAEVKTTTMTTTTQSVLTEEQKAALDDFLGMMGDEPRLRRSNKNNDDSSSSSSSEEDNNNNDKHSNKNDDDDNRHSKKKPHKHHHDDDDDDDNNNDDDDNNKKHKNKNDNNDTSSSSSSSSEENHRNKRDVSSDDASASTEQKSNEENNDLHPLKQKRSADKSSSEELNPDGTKKASGSSSEEHNTEENRVKRNVETSEEISSEESKGGVKKRSIPSYFVKISPDEKNFVLNLADYSINTLDDIDSDNHKRVVLQILAAKKSEEPITILYHLTLRVGISRCPEDNAPIDLTKIHKNTDKCKEDLFENLTKICKIQVEVTKEKKNPKVVKSHCQNMKKDPVDSDVNRTFRAKRGGVPGGVNNADVNDPKLKKFMEDTLKQMDESDGNGKKTELIEIVSAKTQVVAGMKYIIDANMKINGETKRCNLVIWDRPWIKTEGKEITINCENSATSSKLYRVRRSHVQKQILGKDDHDVNVGMFKEFAQTHNKSYSSKSEFKKRYNIYRQNMKMIKTLNENEQGTAKYGPTMFADLTREEFKRYLGLNPALKHPNNIPYPDAQIPDIDLPNEFDWRTKGAVTEVKNQGSCGSCWAFSVTGNIEGQNAIKTGKLIELSEQELVDCDTLDSGCNGGLPDNAYRAIEQIGGLETETDYPYDAEDEKCHFKKSLARVQISGAVNISSNETNMAKWLVSNGPISIGINANAMQFYMGGVSHPWKFLCSPENLDHGVLIVGYGVHKYPLFNRIMPYWIVKNSWGPTWGEQGYYRVYRGDGTCGVNQMASSAII